MSEVYNCLKGGGKRLSLEGYAASAHPRKGGGSRAFPACSAHQVYSQSPDTLGPVSHLPLPRAQGHSAQVLPLITYYFGRPGAVVHGGTTSYRHRT